MIYQPTESAIKIRNLESKWANLMAEQMEIEIKFNKNGGKSNKHQRRRLKTANEFISNIIWIFSSASFSVYLWVSNDRATFKSATND